MKQELAVKTKLQPPPTKTEVINALVQIGFEKWSATKKEILAKEKAIEDRLKSAAFKLAKRSAWKDADITIRTYGSAPYVNISIEMRDVSLNDDLRELRTLQMSDTPWDEHKERVKIRNAMNGVSEGRVEAMLGDEETRKKLVSMGTEIGVL